MQPTANIAMVEIVAQGLGHLLNDMVFIGGTAMSFYVDDPASSSPRPTEDVDCLVELSSFTDYYQLERQLRTLGFQNQQEYGAPICRWIYRDIKVDIMPTDPKILGFSNSWYPEGMRHAEKYTLPSHTPIQIFHLAYFLATKFEAFFDRGGGDLRFSHDFEDIIYVLDGCRHAKKRLESAPLRVRRYLADTFKKLAKDPIFAEAISAHLDGGGQSSVRKSRIVEILSSLL